MLGEISQLYGIEFQGGKMIRKYLLYGWVALSLLVGIDLMKADGAGLTRNY